MISLKALGLVSCLAALINLPLGNWRARTNKFSLNWFVSIHASIPLIYYFRTQQSLPPATIPLLIAAAVLGQLVGSQVYQTGRLRPADKKRKADRLLNKGHRQ